MRNLRTCHEPPPPSDHNFLRRIKQKQSWTFGIYSPSFWGCWVHWMGSRTVPCYENKEKCAGHKMGSPVKWLGYLFGYNHEMRRDEFLELPNGAALELIGGLGIGTPLRGCRVKFRRGDGKTARVHCEVLVPWSKISNAPLPASKDPEKMLRAIWGLNEAKLRLAGTDEVPEMLSA